ncbi:MAG: hypothetical protein UU51_C0007G0002 [Microgenomates group bacterium GW2011_GWC1_41_20]|uniref:Uncharacterized protein n=7 Tax=Candidatus Woeseibacteriota TaxID=1752722 RepID=A0A0G0RTW5_9BACT|nr:MAG: hypothetical protein UT76_C0004G0004 [Candidatus Woesebacteria bacterium GW2011_GWB1_40_12]KKR56089.1 MAG: hypothetical protein UT93_C0005G0006 [Candidatus Woesebacteria bacterium GW2011_GWF1_40_24]KKR90388.1 MAG: hypothetical protein UU39_C0014G0003 [Candidatus Woesebacteria bacterium GW2011_GWD1_41_12]KKS00456.1 MAG: hypothetical protein UU51_C0007G0002 [Microgenomates group bacterium GW2011_GWC1_41_20]KKS04290.1 MAG: hypothetical protein UU57_C0022G0015 [Candidatus Woesebacteria bact
MIKPQKGQSLFEVVVAIAVSALIITAIVSMASNSIQNSSYSRDKTLASNYVQQANEWLRQERDSNSATFITKAAIPTWCFRSLSWILPSLPRACASDEYITGTKFIRQSGLSISLVNGKNVVRVNTTVSWTDSKGLHQITGSTDLSATQ